VGAGWRGAGWTGRGRARVIGPSSCFMDERNLIKVNLRERIRTSPCPKPCWHFVILVYGSLLSPFVPESFRPHQGSDCHFMTGSAMLSDLMRA